MKYAICIMAHGKPALLDRIVKKLKKSNTEIYIHLDSKCDIADFKFISDAVFITKRISVVWGGSSMIIAMYNLVEHVIRNSDCGYLLFISGEDYPVVNPLDYDKYIIPANNYLEYSPLPRENWKYGGIDRIKYYYLFKSYKSIWSKLIIRIQKILGVERKNVLNQNIYGGSQWININRESAIYIMEHWDRYYRFFRYTKIPDELIFQTIILNSENGKLVKNTNLRYLNFEEGSPHPNYLHEEDYCSIIGSKALFCRKIENETIFDAFDKLEKSIAK